MPPVSAPSSTLPSPSKGSPNLADKIDMQNRLFAELSRMFGVEVPLYDKSLLVNKVCNTAVCDLLSQMFAGFSISSEQLDKTSGERHGAIRIGRPDEYRLIGRFFAAFGMYPHNFFDMTSVGGKSQPVIATAFRSTHNPEHRVFSSLLQPNYFDDVTRGRIEAALAKRQVFSDRAKALLDKNERQGGLDGADADALIREGCDQIFKWKGTAHDYELYKDLSESGFKITPDITCFDSHHLNHLTPNTFCMDLYTAAMKHCLGELTGAELKVRATRALSRVQERADHDFLRLQFKHLSHEQIETYTRHTPPQGAVARLVDALAARLVQGDLQLSRLPHSGFKDTTEGPSEDTPILLRQDAYRALTEKVLFRNADGTTTNALHTARFGEIEQRGYAPTSKGRALYDACLEKAEADDEKDLALLRTDFAAYEKAYAKHFAKIPKTLSALLAQGLVHARYNATARGRAARGTITTFDIHELVKQGFATREGLRYEDFLPVSAAGIFASNLNQYGTASTATVKPTYSQKMLEDILGAPIIDSAREYAAVEAASLLKTYADLGLMEMLGTTKTAELERIAAG